MKYIIDIPKEYESDWVNKSSRELCFPINETATNKKYHIPTGLKLESYTEPDRKAIEDEVWELARIVTSMNMQDYMQCFGEDAALVMTYQEAKAKYDAWKKEKEEVHVGDEVTAKTDTDKDMPKGIVTYNNPEQSQFLVIKSDGTFSWWHKGGLRKTGRHFDEVERLLERMKAK